MTMIVVTPEVAFAREVVDRVIFMDEGWIVEQGPPGAVLGAPKEERTQRFMRMLIQPSWPSLVSEAEFPEGPFRFWE